MAPTRAIRSSRSSLGAVGSSSWGLDFPSYPKVAGPPARSLSPLTRRDIYQQALPLFERALGPEDLRLVGPLANLADVYRALGKFDRAEVLYARLAFLMEEAFGPSDIHLGAALASTAEAVASQGQYARAKNLYQRALSIYLTSLGTEDPRTVRLLSEFAELLVKLNRRDEAEALKAGA